jgi:general secretion pathway protein A
MVPAGQDDIGLTYTGQPFKVRFPKITIGIISLQRAEMYTSYYGLDAKPFNITPDIDNPYLSPNHREALTHLEYGLMGQTGLMVLTGDVGTGKTTIVRHATAQFCTDRLVAVIDRTNVSPDELFHLICTSLDIKVQGGHKIEKIEALKQSLQQHQKEKKQVLIIVEEAQSLSDDTIEEIRLLTNIQMDFADTLQILLIGQSDFLERLQSPGWASLGQRVGVGFHLEGLDFERTCHYIRHRLAMVGGKLNIFSKEALKQIFEASRGIPRLINIFCDGALIYGYGDELKTIKAVLVKKVVKERAGIGLGHPPTASKQGKSRHPIDQNGHMEDRLSRLEADIKRINDQLEWHQEDLSILNIQSKDNLLTIVKSVMAKERRLRKHLEREIKQLTRLVKKMPDMPQPKGRKNVRTPGKSSPPKKNPSRPLTWAS